MAKVVVMGSATIDLFAGLHDSFSNCKSGCKILVDDLEYETGGGGTNVSVSLARLSVDVSFLGKLGSDQNAGHILDELASEKVKVIPTKLSKKSTSFSVIMESSKEDDRIIYTYKGASNDLMPKDFSMRKVSPEWLYVASMVGDSFKTAQLVAKHVRENGGRVLFNPSEYLTKEPAKLKAMLKLTTVLVLNKREAQLLTKSRKEIKALAMEILKMGPESVIITQGKHGVTFFDKLMHLHVHSPAVKVVSTAGAGDAFSSTFLGALMHELPAIDALKLGVLNATNVIQHRGAKNGLLKWKDLIALSKKKRLKSRKLE